MRDLRVAENEAFASHKVWHHQIANTTTFDVPHVLLFRSVRGSWWPKQLLHGFREEGVASAAGMPLTREATRTPWTRAATTGGWQEKRLPKQWRHAASVGERRSVAANGPTKTTRFKSSGEK